MGRSFRPPALCSQAGVPTGVPQRLLQGSAPQTCACPSGGPERSEGGRRRDATAGQAVSPRAATLDTPPRLLRVPAADSPATHRHSSSTLSSCRLLDCTPWAPAAASRLRLLLRLLPPAAARRPDKRAEGDSGRGGPRSKGSPERDGSGCLEGRRAQSEVGSGADARHSAGVGLWVVGLRGGRDHCGCPEGGHTTDRRRDRARVNATGRGGSRALVHVSHTVRRCVQADFGPAFRVQDAQPPGSPLGLARIGCAWAEPAHSAPAQTYPGQSGPLRQGSRRSPPPPPRRSSPSPPRAAGTRGDTPLKSSPGLLPGYLVVGYSHVF